MEVGEDQVMVHDARLEVVGASHVESVHRAYHPSRELRFLWLASLFDLVSVCLAQAWSRGADRLE